MKDTLEEILFLVESLPTTGNAALDTEIHQLQLRAENAITELENMPNQGI